MTDQLVTCPRCGGSLVEIEHYGERLVGCVACNRWSFRGSDRLVMELPDDDLDALKDAMTRGRQARSVR